MDTDTTNQPEARSGATTTVTPLRFHFYVSKGLEILRGLTDPVRIRSMVYNVFRKSPLVPNRVLLESHHGREFFGNPYWIARHLTLAERYRHLELVFVCAPEYRSKVRQALGVASIRFCRKKGLLYLWHLARAGYLVNDTTFPPFFSRRDDQKYLNTWHGTPLKTLGRRMPPNALSEVSNAQRNFLHATHLLAPNPHTELALLEDHMVGGLWSGSLLRAGYPRNDPLQKPPEEKLGGGLNVAYMPTWRGTLATARDVSVELRRRIADDLDQLDDDLPPDSTLWVRLHPVAAGDISFDSFRRIRPFPAESEPYEHLAKCDALITDYSSVLFDFAESEKPVLLYTPDSASYEQERSFCLDLEEIPFPRFKELDELIAALKRIREDPDGSPTPTAFLHRFSPHRGSENAKSVCEAFFLSDFTNTNVEVVEPSAPERNVLIFTGDLSSNGLTTSLKSMLPLISVEPWRFWLTLRDKDAQEFAAQYLHGLDDQVGYVPTRNVLAGGPLELFGLLVRQVLPERWNVLEKIERRLWEQEWRRVFGTARFGTTVHYTGYGLRGSYLTTFAPTRKVVYVHNSMGREVEAKRANARTLRKLYQSADRIAVIRRSLIDELNRDIMDVSAKAVVVPNPLRSDCVEAASAPLADALHMECRDFTPRLLQMMDQPNAKRIINLARFSPEKGQARLIAGFEQVWENHCDYQLFILGGHGVIYERIRAQAAASPASEAIFVSRGSANPHPLLTRMDALILGSHYEGLGLVIYEALSLGIPVVSTNIPGPDVALEGGFGLLVENSLDGIVKGLEAAYRGELPYRRYDFETHNHTVGTDFVDLLS